MGIRIKSRVGYFLFALKENNRPLGGVHLIVNIVNDNMTTFDIDNATIFPEPALGPLNFPVNKILVFRTYDEAKRKHKKLRLK